MTTTNPFDLLGGDDNDDPSLLIASVQLKVEKEKPKAGAGAVADKAAPAGKLGGKQQPASKSMNPLQSARNEGAGRDGFRGGRGGSRGGRGVGGYRRDYNNNEAATGNSNGYNYRPSEDGESGKNYEGRGGNSFGPRPRGGRVGGGPRRYGSEEAGEGERPPRRTYDRHSATGRGGAIKRDGAGARNWGTPADDVAPETEETRVENEADVTAEKQPAEGETADATKDVPATETEEKEPEEDKEMTLEEYEKVLEEKRKALLALKAEERKVDAKEFASMQQISSKKENDEIFAKLGSDKDKKKEAAEREERAKKAVSINEFLKPADGESYYRGGGRGGRGGRGRSGRGGGDRGGYGGGGYGRDVSAPSIEDPGQFPSLGGK